MLFLAVRYFKTSKYFIKYGVSETDFWQACTVYWSKHSRLVELKKISAKKRRDEEEHNNDDEEDKVTTQHTRTHLPPPLFSERRRGRRLLR